MMMELDVTLIGSVLGVLLGLITLAAVIKRNFAVGTRENSEAIIALRDTCEALSNRVQTVENEIKHLPSAKDLHELSKTVTAIKGEVNLTKEMMVRIEKSNQRIEGFLLKKNMS